MTARELAPRLRELTGFEEEWIRWGAGAGRNGPATYHELLARCLSEPGAAAAADLEAVRALSLVDRDRLLLELRCRSFGPRVRSEVRCPACGHPALVEFSARELPVRAEPPARLEVELSHGRSIAVRPLTAADHELFFAAEGLDPEAQRALALTRVVVSSTPGAEAGELAPEDLAAVEQALEALGPEPLATQLACETCGQPLAARFDLGAFLLAELREHARVLLDDIHTLAQVYHWSQREILGLSLRRRLEYLTRIEAGRDSSLLRFEEVVR